MAVTLHYPFKDDASVMSAGALAASIGPTLTVVRATDAMIDDADGWLRNYQDNEARFPGATFSHNLLTNSEEFDDANWAKFRATVSADAVADPNGDTTADKLVEDSTLANNHYTRQAFSAKGNHYYAFSVYLKAAERTWARVALQLNSTPSVDVNLSTGTLGTETGTNYGTAISDEGNGWYRVSIVGLNASDATRYTNVYIGEGDNDIIFDGDGSSGIYVWGAQLEDVSGAWDSQNFMLYSEEFDNGWSLANIDAFGSGSVIDTTDTTDPNGGNTAEFLRPSTVAGYARKQHGAGSNDGDTVRFSIYVKTGGYDTCRLRMVNVAAGTPTPTFTFSTGTITDDFYAEDVGNGWYRISMWARRRSASTAWCYIYPCGAGESIDGTSGIYVWGAQAELNKPANNGPTTYVQTTTAAVTNYSPSTYIATTTVPVTSLSGTNDGLLIEEARTNICLQSEDLSTTWTTEGQGTISTDQIIAPDGSLTADKLVDDGLGGGPGTCGVRQAITLTTSTAYTYSVFIKADQLSWAYLVFDAGVTEFAAYFNLSDGTVGTEVNSPTATGVEDYGNGWYRCYIVATSDGTAGDATVRCADADNDQSVDFDGTSSIFVWGAQLEAGAYRTSYIPTTTGSVTRNADAISGSDLSWWNVEGTTYYQSYQAVVSPGSARSFLMARNAGTTDYLQLLHQDANKTRVKIVDDGVQQTNFQSATDFAGANVLRREAVGVEENNFEMYVDGTRAATGDQVGTVPEPDSTFYIGSNHASSWYVNSVLAEIAALNERLTDANLSDLSDGTKTVSGNFLGPPAGTTANFVNGIAITSDGALRMQLVAADYAEQAGDVYISGVRHDSNGIMYCTSDAVDGNEVFINAIAHSTVGVRYVQEGDTTVKIPGGRATDSNGAQAYFTDSANIVGYFRSFGLDTDGAIFFNT